MAELIMTEEGSTPSTPGANKWKIYPKSDGFHIIDDAGLEIGPFISINGWIPVYETWTRTGNHTFTVSGDLTTTYRKGAKIRYKDGGAYEYGVVGASSYSSPNTTVTLITNTDYAMAATTITDRYISYIVLPEGWQDIFNYTPAVASSGGSITTYNIIGAKWKTIGKQIKMDVDFKISNNGTGSGQIQVDTPITVATASTGPGREYAIDGKMLQVVCDGTQTFAKIFNYDGSYPGGTNYQLVFNVMFGF